MTNEDIKVIQGIEHVWSETADDKLSGSTSWSNKVTYNEKGAWILSPLGMIQALEDPTKRWNLLLFKKLNAKERLRRNLIKQHEKTEEEDYILG